uniref:Uncharacterized protein n=1 Tax=Parascaris univalens TaxID=6257 RepID=A0A915B6M8_PARUN
LKQEHLIGVISVLIKFEGVYSITRSLLFLVTDTKKKQYILIGKNKQRG